MDETRGKFGEMFVFVSFYFKFSCESKLFILEADYNRQ